jgi:hypothetical protein
LGYGAVTDAVGQAAGEGLRHGKGKGEGETEWAVTYFAKTLFTPAGIDIYTRPRPQLPESLLEEIKARLKGTGEALLATLVDELFMVKHDG